MENQPAETALRGKVEMVQQALRTLEIETHQAGLSYDFTVMAVKRQLILANLERNKGNQCETAREMGIHRNTLTRTMRELKINPHDERFGRRRNIRSVTRLNQRRVV